MSGAGTSARFFGTTSSALGTEGSSPGSDWRRWEEQGRAPSSRDGNGFATNHADDLELLASLGVRHHRLSVDWARVEPANGRFHEPALDHLAAVVGECRAVGVEPWVCLHHTLTPGWFVDEGGFADDRARSRFWPRFVDTVAQRIGDDVAGWFTFHEPASWAWNGWLAGTAPPGRVHDLDGFATALRGAWLAHRDAWRQLRGGPPVATSTLLAPVQADTAGPDRVGRDDVRARQAARRVDRLLWGVTVDALRDGVLDVPGKAVEQVADLAGSYDLLGFTYRGGVLVGAGGVLGPYPGSVRRDRTGAPWWPEGLGTVIRRVAELLPDRRLVLAGFGVATDEDTWRCDVLAECADQLASARADGIDVAGAFHHTFVDGYEGIHGFTAPFGIADRDRVPRTSAQVLGGLAAAWAAGAAARDSEGTGASG